MGIGPLLMTRLGGFVAAVSIFSILVGLVVFAPLMVVGAWRRRWSVDFGPFLAYAILLVAFSAIVSAIHVPGGTFIHSAVALAPHGYVLALEGIIAVVAWIATKRRHWDAPSASRVFIGGAVAFGVIGSIVGVGAVHASWDSKRNDLQAVAGALDAAGAPASDRVMAIDASGIKYWTGHPGVVLVDDPLDTVEKVARAYGIRWLVLEPKDSVAAVTDIFENNQRPPWVGPPVLREDTVALYPVCLDPGDTRCGTGITGAVR